jgi:hypothetical protein
MQLICTVKESRRVSSFQIYFSSLRTDLIHITHNIVSKHVWLLFMDFGSCGIKCMHECVFVVTTTATVTILRHFGPCVIILITTSGYYFRLLCHS